MQMLCMPYLYNGLRLFSPHTQLLTIENYTDIISLTCSWEVKCCRLCDYCAHDCHLNPEGYINSAGNYMSYTADDKAVFVGLFTDLDDVSR